MDSATPKKIPIIPIDGAKDFRDGKVIIIGAGVAGLFAANTLKYMGVDNYIVLEAADTFGGRLKSAETFHNEVPLDVGAEWIHSANEDVVKEILVFRDKEAEKDGVVGGLGPSEFLVYKPEFFFRSKSRKILSWFYQETKWKRSTWFHYLEKFVFSHVKDKVEFNAPVKEIVYTDDVGMGNDTSGNKGIKVVMENGTEHWADKVICTIPLAVLKKGDAMIKFDPPLPMKKRDAIEAIDMPPGFRVLFEMKEKFYPDATLDTPIFKVLLDGGDLRCVYDPLFGKELSNTSNQNILAFVAIGNKHAGSMSKLDDEELAKAALGRIDELFNGQGSKNYVKHVVQNWTTEPYILGAYSFPCARHHRLELQKTVSGKILFAGEHTSLKYDALVPGAALEGRRAAVEAVSGRIIC